MRGHWSFYVATLAFMQLPLAGQAVAAEAYSIPKSQQFSKAQSPNPTPAQGASLKAASIVAEPEDEVMEENEDDALRFYEAKPAMVFSVGGEAGIKYQDNVFRAPTNTQSDSMEVLSPVVRLNGSSKDVKYDGRLNVEHGHFNNYDENNYTDIRLNGRTQFSVTEETEARVNMNLMRDHTPIGANDDPDRAALGPTIYKRGGLEAELEHAAGIVELLGKGKVEVINYDNITRANGTKNIQDDRDGMQYTGGARATYAANGDLKPFVELNASSRTYDDRVDGTVLRQRDEQDGNIMVGIAWQDVSRRLKGEIAAGPSVVDFESKGFDDYTDVAVAGSLSWQVNDVSELELALERTVNETTFRDASSEVRTEARVQGKTMLDDNWLLSGDFRLQHSDFQTDPTAAERVDVVTRADAQLEYFFADTTSVGLRYEFSDRSSDFANAEYTTNEFMLFVSEKY